MPSYRIPAYRGDAPFAFVSYAHADAERVFAELEALHEDGLRIYYDEGIAPGHAWHDDLAEAIERCSVFILFVTEASVSSRNCLRELNFALDRNRDIIAVHLDNVDLPRGLHLALGDRQAIVWQNFSAEEYRARLHGALSNYLSASGDNDDDKPRADIPVPKAAQPAGQRRRLVLPIIALAVLVAGASVWLWQSTQTRQAEQDAALAEFESAVRADDKIRAYMAGLRLPDASRSTPGFSNDWNYVTTEVQLSVEHEGVDVKFRPYGDSDGQWIDLGTTPLEPARLPNAVIELRLQKQGHVDGSYAVAVPGPVASRVDGARLEGPGPPSIAITLPRIGDIADDMVLVPAMNTPLWIPQLTRDVRGSHSAMVPAFAVQRYEVSNAEYQAFVDAGGYGEVGFWQDLGLDDKDAIDAALAKFVDETGNQGPAGWSLGRYPEGEGELPVAGISWYEAKAYARFRGMTLPTIYHWARYAMGPFEGFAVTVPTTASTGYFTKARPTAVDTTHSLGPWGTVHTAGNVAEWLHTGANDERLLMGGSFDVYPTSANNFVARDPMLRTAVAGLRLVQLLDTTELPPELFDPVTPIDPEVFNRQPVTDDAFEIIRQQYSGSDREPVSVSIETMVEADAWSLERHDLSYGGDASFTVYVLRPQRRQSLYQPVVYGPHGGAFFFGGSFEARYQAVLNYAIDIARSGRMVFMPEWADSLSRYTPRASDPAQRTEDHRAAMRAWYQDSLDTLNYIETLSEVDPSAIGYFGESFGTSVFGPMLLALQPRYRAAVFLSAGVVQSLRAPMTDSLNYLPRVTQPLLMINGSFDPAFPQETSQRPFFEALGTPVEHKKTIVYPGGHFDYPRNQVAGSIDKWFDRYLN